MCWACLEADVPSDVISWHIDPDGDFGVRGKLPFVWVRERFCFMGPSEDMLIDSSQVNYASVIAEFLRFLGILCGAG